MIDCAEKNDTTYTICYRVKETLLTRYQTLRTFYFEGYLVLHVAGLSNWMKSFIKMVLCKRKKYYRSFEFNILNEKPYKRACPVDAL